MLVEVVEGPAVPFPLPLGAGGHVRVHVRARAARQAPRAELLFAAPARHLLRCDAKCVGVG